MIVCLRLEVSDEERSVLSLRTHPKALKRLATGAEMKALIAEQWANNIKPQDDVIAPAERYRPFDDKQEMRHYTPITNDMIDDVVKTPVKHADEIGVPVVVSKTPLMGFRKLLHHVNCAMFSIANARRMAAEHCPDGTAQLDDLAEDIETIQRDLSVSHDEMVEDD